MRNSRNMTRPATLAAAVVIAIGGITTAGAASLSASRFAEVGQATALRSGDAINGMHDQEFRACPLIAGRGGADATDFLCAWPGVLVLSADDTGASFTQHWQVEAESWVPLPGTAQHWPQQVSVDGRPAVVVDHEGPSLRLAVGSHALRWFADRSTDALPVARAISLPLWVHKIAMLAWALWLASALVGWLRKGFAAWMQGGYWRKPMRPIVDVPRVEPPEVQP